ncbi:MAG: virulence factor [Actinomycetota bacterium]
MPRRSRGGPGLVTIYWRDIPAQVTATTDDGSKEQVLMDPRFQVAIDRAAAVAGLTTTDDYVNEWRRVATSVDGDPIAAAHATAEQLDNDISRDVLKALVANGGIDPESGVSGVAPDTENPTPSDPNEEEQP